MSGQETNALQPHYSFVVKHACSGLNETSCANKENTLDKKCGFILKLDPQEFLQVNWKHIPRPPKLMNEGVLIRSWGFGEKVKINKREVCLFGT